MHYLYRITDTLNGKVYIGQSNKENERWRQHKYFAKQDEPIQYVHRAMKKYGVHNFTYEVIAMCQSQEDADWTETELIKQYDSQNKEHGYNVALGGDHAWNAGLPTEQQPMYGKHHTEESKAQISKSNMGKIMPLHTDEWKVRQKVWVTGRTVSEKTREKMSLAQIGKFVSEETRNNMSESAKVKVFTEQHKENISKSLSGVKKEPFSQKHRNNLSDARIGKTHAPEVKIKMSNSHKKFSSEQELQIVDLRKLGALIANLASKFGCSEVTISAILKRNKKEE